MIGFLRKGAAIEEDAINSGIKTSSSPWPIADKWRASCTYATRHSLTTVCRGPWPRTSVASRRFGTFTEAVTYLSRAKFEADDGKSGDDHRCFPAQRARIWPVDV